ncbi:MAG: hypothetical protein C4333_11715 [Meiothermus sp.]
MPWKSGGQTGGAPGRPRDRGPGTGRVFRQGDRLRPDRGPGGPGRLSSPRERPQHRPTEALERVGEQPFGQVILGLAGAVALGLIAYGIFVIAQSHYRIIPVWQS